MNQKITLARLAALVAEKNGCSAKESEDVLRLLFQYIGASLEGGEPTKVKGLGTFKLSRVEARKSVDVTTGQENEIPAHRRIVFIPSKELASAVNAPFEMFETVVIEENVLEEELMEAESENNTLLIDSLQQQIILEEEKADALKEKFPAEFAEPGEAETPKADIPKDEEPKVDDLIPDTPKPEAATADVLTAAGPTADNPDSDVDKTIEQSYPASDDSSDTPSDTSSETPSGTPSDNESGANDDKDIKKATPASEESMGNDEEDNEDEENSAEEIPEKRRSSWVWYVVGGLIAIILGIGVLWFVNDDFASKGRELLGIASKDSTTNAQEEAEVATLLDNEANMTEENSDMTGLVEEEGQDPENDAKEAELEESKDDASADAVPTAPSDAKAKSPEYDTITKTRYLTTLAKEHYGNFHLWPYIYKENEKILGHPDRIKPGTKVVIPDLSKYGVDPKNPADIAKAKKLGVEIYKKYK